MDRIFEIASRVSTPLALAGFFAAIVFLILRQILKKDIFPSLTRQLSSEIIKMVIKYLFILSLVAMVLGFAGYVITALLPTGNGDRIRNGNTSGNDTEDAESLFKKALANVKLYGDAVIRLNKLDRSVDFHTKPSTGVEFHRLVGDLRAIRAVKVDFGLGGVTGSGKEKKNTSLTDDDLKRLSKLTTLQILVLTDNHAVTDISPLAKCKDLDYLNLSGTRIDDIGALTALKNLRILILTNTNVSDVVPLAKLPRLQFLELGADEQEPTPAEGSQQNTRLSKISVLAPSVTELRVTNAMQLKAVSLNDASLKKSDDGSLKLTSLTLEGSLAQTVALKGLKQLERLDIKHCLTESLDLSCLPWLGEIQIIGNSELRKIVLEDLPELTRVIIMENSKLGDNEKAPALKLVKLPKLEFVVVKDNPELREIHFSETGAPHPLDIDSNPQLKVVRVSGQHLLGDHADGLEAGGVEIREEATAHSPR